MLASLLNIDICKFEDREFKENTDIELSTLRFFKNPVRLGDRNFVKLLQTEDTLKERVAAAMGFDYSKATKE